MIIGILNIIGSIATAEELGGTPITNVLIAAIFISIGFLIYDKRDKTSNTESIHYNPTFHNTHNETLLKKYPILIYSFLKEGESMIKSCTHEEVIITTLNPNISLSIQEHLLTINISWILNDEKLGNHERTWVFSKAEKQSDISTKVMNDIAIYSNQNFSTNFNL